MFEEICLACGKHLFDYGSAYCSDDCQGRDATSPSISSSSSALSSPHLGYANGSEVPPLMPSALGSALKNIRNRDPYSVPSSASSVAWSGIGTDDEDDNVSIAVRAECSDGSELAQDGISKQLGFAYLLKPSALQYTRRPSGTNNHSTVPHVHRRMSSSTSSSSGHVRGIPRSAPHPSHSSTEDDEAFSDLGLSSRENLDTEESDVPSEKGSDRSKPNLDAGKTKRARNRASLPACFSLLQFNSPGKKDPRSSPVSSSSGHTVAQRPSPPTPKMGLASRPSQVSGNNPPASVHTTPRGRRRAPDESSSSHRSDSSISRSRSRGRQPPTELLPRIVERDSRPRYDGREGADWSSVPGQPIRGRTTVRRNSSPPPKVLIGMEDRGRTLAAVRQAEIFDRSQSGSRNSEKPRGRARVQELDGIGFSTQAPGYGGGRSGLIGRERDRERERSLGFVGRVPL
ncbi:hypothetical protein P691DRAFT_793318 [Macrolepiota fuliginosa MF-IS2]|uniref:Uncharacterized protein n=1 Tax=Macrolepiota fuliginosa MF-IS2 TaxID=1400762 RepID=A0A9P5XDQ4_9AGAR|nr:hypothetical protein P691DRAFT_793318 [Macrolepiota fuliginosa MF-IS2]